MPTVQLMRWCAGCDRKTLHVQQKESNIFHLLMTLITFGLWILIWIFAPLRAGSPECTVCGEVTSRKWPVGAIAVALLIVLGGVVSGVVISGVKRTFKPEPPPLQRPLAATASGGYANVDNAAGTTSTDIKPEHATSSGKSDNGPENGQIIGSWVLANCVAVQVLAPELQISFARLDGDLVLVMTTPRVRFDKRNDAVIGLAVDGRRWNVNAFSDPGGSAGAMVVIPIVDPEVRNALRLGNNARISVGEGWADFSLSGSARSMHYVQNCRA